MITAKPRGAVALALPLLFSLLVACSDGGDGRPDDDANLGVPGSGDPDIVAVPPAAIGGPIAGNPVLVSTFFPLASVGYEQAEYFVSGTANAYVNSSELGQDGRWQVQASDRADYRTRIVVYRPSNPADFNGTVVVEWLNVSAGFDSAPDWGMLHTELIRSGYAWVGISAQEVGVQALVDGSAAELIPGTPDTGRYASLVHPGDAYSYDIYSQLAQALRNPVGDSAQGVVADAEGPSPDLPLANPLWSSGGLLEAQQFIAIGESQSAGRLLTYVNAFAPIHARFEGYLIHSRTGGSAPLVGGFIEPELPTPEVVRVREDLGVPVLMLQTETDLFILDSWPSNQPDSAKFRLWEIAGSAHADLYTFLDNRFDVGNDPGVAAVAEVLDPIPDIIECTVPVNAGPQHWVAKAAIAALNEWVVSGVAPPQAERLAVDGDSRTFELDAQGNVLGGIRTPYVDAPIAVLSGEGQPQPNFDELDEISVEEVDFCFLSGTTKLFDAATLGSLYDSNEGYIEAVNHSADEAVSNGFLLRPDAELIKAWAADSDIFAP